MRTEYLLFPIYLLLSFWIIPRIAFIRNSGLCKKEIRVLLAIKVIIGIASASYFQWISTNIDYIGYNEEGKVQYELLLSNPRLFFTDFSININKFGLSGLFESKDSFWAYLRFNLLHKFIAFSDLVSGGNFYFNSAIFCTLVFFGHIGFYRIYCDIYKGHKWKILLACLLLPSLALYTSCVHKDGIVFLCLGILSFIFYRFLIGDRLLSFKYVFFFVAALGIIFLFRNYLFIALVPAMLIALLCKWLPYRRRFIFIGSYCFFCLAFFLSGSTGFFNLPDLVVRRKADFALLEGGTTNIPMNDLQANTCSFLSNLPQAVNHALFRPYVWEFSQPGIILTALELLFYQIMALVFIFYRKRPLSRMHAFNLFGIAFFVHMILIIGYTIPNIGAIVRYRSIFWLFLLCPVLCNINWAQFPILRKFLGQDPIN